MGYNLNNGSVKYSCNYGDVSSSNNKNVGGIIGNAKTGIILDSFNEGEVSGSDNVGGIFGQITGTSVSITNCYNTGIISGDSTIGGIIGNIDTVGDISNCYYLDSTASCGVGSTSSTEGEKTETDLKKVETFVNYDATIWKLVDGEYPSLIW